MGVEVAGQVGAHVDEVVEDVAVVLGVLGCLVVGCGVGVGGNRGHR